VIGTIATHELVMLRRQRVASALLAAMLIVTALAGLLGWSSQHTIVRVYDQAVTLLSSTGQPAPPNPFLLKPSLSLLSNMVVYIPMIGALLALVLGHLSIVDDRNNGTGRLVFSRQVTRSQYALGKVTGAVVVLAILLLASGVVSVVSLLVVNGSISMADLARLALFYLLSWVYLAAFVLIGILTVLITSRTSMALLSALGVWMVITFVVPQFTSGLRPTQSLNPIAEPIGTSQTLFRITHEAQPLSVVEQYKSASGVILRTSASEPLADTVHRVLPILGLAALLLALTLWLIQRHDFARTAAHD
jgi:ABC-2 type transport system permease protein